MQRLFTYGTLMCADIMRRVAGECLILGNASLRDYRCLCVRNELYPAVVRRNGYVTTGVLYDGISAAAFNNLDEFEGEMYRRDTVPVSLSIGEELTAFTYVFKSEYEGRLLDEDWRFERFLRVGKESFIAEYLD